MKTYQSNVCTLCVGLCVDINGNCPNKDNCSYLKDEKKFEKTEEAFSGLLNQISDEVNAMLQQGQMDPEDELTINIDIKKR